MTHFFLGFFSAIALLAVTVIVWAVVVYRRQEQQRQAAVDAIMAKVIVQGYQPSAPSEPPVPPRGGTAVVESPQAGKKGIH